MALFSFLTAFAASSLLLGADARPLQHGHPNRTHAPRHRHRHRVTVRVRGCDGTDRSGDDLWWQISYHCGGHSADGTFKRMCVEE